MTNPTGPTPEDIELAQDLLAEWDQGRGTSKSEIERRVWGDGGAHGRRFDRFVRQALGVNTNRPSKQTDRIGLLESQLRRLGVVPAETTLAEWETQLNHGRHAALAAIRVWNDPTASFRTESFALLLVTAWNSIAIAILQRSPGGEWRRLDAEGRPERTADGVEMTLETSELVGAALPDDEHVGLRRNVEFWIGLRNHVAHRHLPALDAVVIPQAQAALLNLEHTLAEHFGDDYLIGDQLSVPLQLSGFRDPGVLRSLKDIQKGLPLDVQTFLANAAERNEALLDDPTYMLRVTFLPTVPSSGRNPDVVAYFVRPGELPDEVADALDKYVVLSKVIRPERPNLIPTQVVADVQQRIPYRFTMPMHAEASRRLGARPARDAPDQTATDLRYCEYVTSLKRHLYNEAWIKRLVTELSSPEGFLAATGVPARRLDQP